MSTDIVARWRASEHPSYTRECDLAVPVHGLHGLPELFSYCPFHVEVPQSRAVRAASPCCLTAEGES